MPKKHKNSARKHHHVRNRVTGLHTWTRDENIPFAETEYPFEHAVSVGEYSDLFERDMGPGLMLYPSTICLSRQDSHDSMVLALLGEHFREFYPDEEPWMSKSTEQMSAAMLLSGQREDIEELNDTLTHFAEKGFLELDLSIPDTYRYRLNVDAVREAKNACFKPMNTVEQIEHDYALLFPDIELQQRAFALICERSLYQGCILLTAWHLALRETAWFTKHTEGKLHYLLEDDILAVLPASVPDSEKRQQALDILVKKGLLKVKYHGRFREYCPHAGEIWEALEKLPQDVPDIKAMGGYRDAEDSVPDADK